MKIFLIFVIFSRAYHVKPARLQAIEIGGAFGLNRQPRSCFSCLRSGILDKAVITIIFFKLSIVNLAVASSFDPVAQTACAVYLNLRKPDGLHVKILQSTKDIVKVRNL